MCVYGADHPLSSGSRMTRAVLILRWLSTSQAWKLPVPTELVPSGTLLVGIAALIMTSAF